jgi:hypothetical protein
MKKRFAGSVALSVLASWMAGCGYTRVAEEVTDDGLTRVPSRAAGGVYRNLDVDFTPYKRVMLEPPTIEFFATWRDTHPELSDKEVMRIQGEAVKLFRDEFKRELVDRGPYEFAEAPAPDVILVTPRILNLDIPAPQPDNEIGTRTYTPGPVKMEVVGDLRDATSNALLGRITIFEGQTRYGLNELRQASRASNAHEMRLGFAKWSKMVHEALNVAKATRRK